MRVISGYLKGKNILFLKSSITRPLKDVVNENIFNIIQHSNLIKISLIQSSVLDLYSGVGSFGIECISRGAKEVSFVEKNNETIEVLNNNLINLNIEAKSTLYQKDTFSFLKNLKKDDKYNMIFLDPPFAEKYFLEDLKLIKNYKIFKKDHLIIIHRDVKSVDDIKNELNVLFTREYGRSKIIFGTF